jgi:beta-glucuronidase
MVPSAFNVAPNPPPQVADQGPHWVVGQGWYRRTVTVPTDWPAGTRASVRLDGVLLRARAWWDGVEIGTNRFGHVPVTLEVGEVAPGATHLLVVQADNTVLEKAIPDPDWDGWWNHGGITREVTLEGRPGPARVSGLWMETAPAGDGWAATFFVAAGGTDGPATVELSDAAGGVTWSGTVEVHADGTAGSATAHLAGVLPWSPEEPALYTLTAVAGGHSRSVRVGFREVRVAGTRLLLNGQPVVLKGLNRHEDVPGTGPVVPLEQARADLLDLKALGANTLRMAHYPDDPRVFDLCDELGLLVWAEIPAWHTSEHVLGDPQVQAEWGEGWLAAMIGAHRHHPSVILWSVGNEFESQTFKAESYCRRMMDFVRALDPTRPVVYASDKHMLVTSGFQMDRCLPLADLVALNEYYGWYYGDVEDVGPVLDAMHELLPGVPVLVSEVGAEAPPGVHVDPVPEEWGEGQEYSEEFQAEFLRVHLDAILAPARADWMLGALVWVYADFPDPHRVGWTHPPAWRYQNNKGLVSRARVPKLGWEVVREAFGGPGR